MTHRPLSIIIPARNEARHIERCIEDVLAQQSLPLDTEILIADGASSDGTREIIESWSARDARVILVHNPEQTTSYGLNRAIERASGEVILRMDVHTEYAPDYVQRCVELLAATGADNVGGPARVKAAGYVQEANALAYQSPFSVGGARFHDAGYRGPVDTVVYGCWNRSLFERIGMFDTELVRNQDDEFNLRTVRSGGQLWQDPGIRSWYYPRDTLRGLFRQYLQYGYWKVRVIQKHRLPASLRHLVPGGFVALVVTSAVFAPFFGGARVALLGLLAVYCMANLAASLLICARPGRWRYLPIMPAVLACYHFGYGIGFLRGVVDFLLLRRSGRAGFGQLTRS